MHVVVSVCIMCFAGSFNKLRHITSYHGKGPQNEWTPGMQNHFALSHVVGFDYRVHKGACSTHGVKKWLRL